MTMTSKSSLRKLENHKKTKTSQEMCRQSKLKSKSLRLMRMRPQTEMRKAIEMIQRTHTQSQLRRNTYPLRKKIKRAIILAPNSRAMLRKIKLSQTRSRIRIRMK